MAARRRDGEHRRHAWYSAPGAASVRTEPLAAAGRIAPRRRPSTSFPGRRRGGNPMRRAALGLAALAVIALTAALARGPSLDAARAASHREAPLISMDPAADITDFFLFRSYEPGREDK